MELTPNQRTALDQGDAIPIVIGQTECVLVRRDIFERNKKDLAPDEAYAAILDAWDATGSPQDGDAYK